GGVASRLAVASGFKLGIFRSLLEEISEGRIQITQRLLKHNGTDFRKKGFLRLFFPLGESGGGGVIVNGFLLLLPGGGAKLQRPIVNITSATEGSGKLLGLCISREESIVESLLDYHAGILHSICAPCEHC